MTLSAPMRCSTLADELDEPMIGTTEHRVRWLLVEDRSAWGHDAVGEVLGRERAATLKAARVRALLIRRREGDPASDAVRRAILVDTVTREMAVRTIGSVHELDPAEVVSTPIREWGAAMSDPIVLVCSNGKRDACCAVRGRLVLGALAGNHAERTWECSHLGGHRFAANVVLLPHGLVHGRVTPSVAPSLVDAYLRGEVDASLFRGRASWPAPAQVAEQAVRLARGLNGVDDLELVSAEVDGAAARVRLRAGGMEHHYDLVAEPMRPPRAISCRADELEQPIHWRIVG